MSTEQTGHALTMFLIDTSLSMSNFLTVQSPNDKECGPDITRFQLALQFVKLKIQEMIYNGHKSAQCGVIAFGSNIQTCILPEQPSAGTLSRLDALATTEDPSRIILAELIDTAIGTQSSHISSHKTWTRNIFLITDGEGQIDPGDLDTVVRKIETYGFHMTIVGVDFDDRNFGYVEENKSKIKKRNEAFYHRFISGIVDGRVETCEKAIREILFPKIKQTRRTLMNTFLRIGDVKIKSDEAIELVVKTSVCTQRARPKGWKKFVVCDAEDDASEAAQVGYAEITALSEYYEGWKSYTEDNVESMHHDRVVQNLTPHLQIVEKEQLVRGFDYRNTNVPFPDGGELSLKTRKGVDICEFFPAKNFRRELSMGEIRYVWANPDSSARQRAAFSSIVQAMSKRDLMAVARWVTQNDNDPKMGVLAPVVEEEVDYLLWAQMPFANDVRKYKFESLDRVVDMEGNTHTKHSTFIPTERQINAMDNFVDAMDLTDAGDTDEQGNRTSWFDTLKSYNPAIQRTREAMFHCALMSGLSLPPPHPEILKYFDTPKHVLERSRDALEECKNTFNDKLMFPKLKRTRKHEDNQVYDEDYMDVDDPLLEELVNLSLN